MKQPFQAVRGRGVLALIRPCSIVLFAWLLLFADTSTANGQQAASDAGMDPPSTLPRAEANDQRSPAGRMVAGELRIELLAAEAEWYPRGPDGPRVVTPAFAEADGPPQVPGPLIRASAGTPVHVTVHNRLDRPIAVRGLLDRASMATDTAPPGPGPFAEFAFVEPLVVPPGETRETRFTPDLYAAAVAMAAPSNLVTTYGSIPAYQEARRAIRNERMGNPETEEGRNRLEAQSPLNFADQITTPLLLVHGANDPRIPQREADRIVVALRDRGYPVQYLVAPDEGHGFRRAENLLAMYAAIEAFLAEHLGGRFQEDMPEEIRQRLEVITVDPTSVTVSDPRGAN